MLYSCLQFYVSLVVYNYLRFAISALSTLGWVDPNLSARSHCIKTVYVLLSVQASCR